jgi:hypothetical protein
MTSFSGLRGWAISDVGSTDEITEESECAVNPVSHRR